MRAIMAHEAMTSEIFIEELGAIAQGYLGTSGIEPYMDIEYGVAVPLPRSKPSTGLDLLNQLVDLGIAAPSSIVHGFIYPELGPLRYQLILEERFKESETVVKIGVWDPNNKYTDNEFAIQAGTTAHSVHVLCEKPLDPGSIYLAIDQKHDGGESGSHGGIGCVYVLKDGRFRLHGATISTHTYYPVKEDENYKPSWSNSTWHVTNMLISGEKPTEPLKANGKNVDLILDGNLLRTCVKLRIDRLYAKQIDVREVKFQLPTEIDPEFVLNSVREMTNPAPDLAIRVNWVRNGS